MSWMSSSNSATSRARITTHFIWAHTVAVQNSSSFQGKGWTTNQSQGYKSRSKSTDLWPWNSGFSSQLPKFSSMNGAKTCPWDSCKAITPSALIAGIFHKNLLATLQHFCHFLQAESRSAFSQIIKYCEVGRKRSKRPPTLGKFSVCRTQNTQVYYTQKVAPSSSDLIHQKRELDFYSNPENP